jgi:Cu(I)/Ag(I) efflux system membrane fusion protein
MRAALFVLGLAFGVLAGGGGLYVWMQQADGGSDEREVLYYRHPMDPSITSQTPAKDNMGMDYIPVYADSAGDPDPDPGIVRIKSSVTQNLGVITAPALKGDLTPAIDALGFVDYNESALAHVHVRTEAWVEDLRVRTTGAPVDEGEILFRIDSPRLINAQAELLQAYRRDSGVTSARQRLRSLGMANVDIRRLEQRGQVLPLVPVRAPRSGFVRELNITEGMYVTPSPTLIEIADLSSVWVMVEVFEPAMVDLRAGQTARVSLPFRPGWKEQAEIDFVYPNLDADSRVQRARLVLDNPDGSLHPGMYADVALQGEPLRDVVHVPAESVIRTGDQQRLVIRHDEERFEVREVRAGRRIDDRMVIRAGLEADESVVVSSHFLIDSEASTVAELDRLDTAEGSQANDAEATPEFWVRARVEELDRDNGTVTLDHEAIPAWGWPAMTMAFRLGDDVETGRLAVGQRARFRLDKGADGDPAVKAVAPLNQGDNGDD